MATNNIQPAPAARDIRSEFAAMVSTRGGELRQLLPGANGDTKERNDALAKFQRQLMTAIDKNPALLDCSPRSFWLASLNIAALGLDPSGNNGEAAIVPFKGVATPMIMARGYVVLAIRSGAAKAIEHNAVCENDLFDYELGSNAYVRHKPALRDRGELIAVWAIATLPTGEKVYEVIGWDEVAAIRARSRSANNGPWVTDPAEMGRKTVLRRIMKRLPWSDDDMMGTLVTVQKDEDAAFGLPELRQSEPVAPPKAGLSGLRDLAAREQQPAPALAQETVQDVSKLAQGGNPQGEPVPVASTPQGARRAATAGHSCPRCGAGVEAAIADEVMKLGNCPACAKR